MPVRIWTALGAVALVTAASVPAAPAQESRTTAAGFPVVAAAVPGLVPAGTSATATLPLQAAWDVRAPSRLRMSARPAGLTCRVIRLVRSGSGPATAVRVRCDLPRRADCKVGRYVVTVKVPRVRGAVVSRRLPLEPPSCPDQWTRLTGTITWSATYTRGTDALVNGNGLISNEDRMGSGSVRVSLVHDVGRRQTSDAGSSYSLTYSQSTTTDDYGGGIRNCTETASAQVDTEGRFVRNASSGEPKLSAVLVPRKSGSAVSFGPGTVGVGISPFVFLPATERIVAVELIPQRACTVRDDTLPISLPVFANVIPLPRCVSAPMTPQLAQSFGEQTFYGSWDPRTFTYRFNCHAVISSQTAGPPAEALTREVTVSGSLHPQR